MGESTYVKQRAVLLSFAEVNCGLPKTGKHVVIDQYLTTTFGNPVNTYHVSVANGNGKFSSPNKYFKVYDSKCMRCTNPKNICHLKVTYIISINLSKIKWCLTYVYALFLKNQSQFGLIGACLHLNAFSQILSLTPSHKISLEY